MGTKGVQKMFEIIYLSYCLHPSTTITSSFVIYGTSHCDDFFRILEGKVSTDGMAAHGQVAHRLHGTFSLKLGVNFDFDGYTLVVLGQ